MFLIKQKLDAMLNFSVKWISGHITNFRSDQISRSVLSDSLRPHESQHARPPCLSPTRGVHSDSCPSSQWWHPAISSSVIPFSSCPQSLAIEIVLCKIPVPFSFTYRAVVMRYHVSFYLWCTKSLIKVAILFFLPQILHCSLCNTSMRMRR